MYIEVHCSRCKRTLRLTADKSGDFHCCPTCGQTILVPLTPGKILSGFRILRKIGSGGMGTVYLAEQTSMGRRVALKILDPRLIRDDRFRTSFEKEIRLQAALNHPNIAVAYDAGSEGPLFYLAMEYIEGRSLEEMTERLGMLPEKTVLYVARQVAVGLSYAWKTSRLIHRDIKPNNIMVNENWKVKVLDMGVSKSLQDSDEEKHSKSVVGTPQYMSPEQMRCREDVDFRTDMFSLGATMYHMLTGGPPFPGRSMAEVMDLQAEGPAPNPREKNAAISASCVHLLRVMMATKPENRYDYWSNLVTDIGRVLSGQKPRAPNPGREESMISSVPRFLGRDQPKSASDTIPLPTLVMPAHRAARAQGNRALWVGGGVALAALGLGLLFLLSRDAKTKPAPPAPSAETIEVALSGGEAVAAQDFRGELKRIEDLYAFVKKRIAEEPLRFADHFRAIARLKTDAEFSGHTKFLLLAEEMEKELIGKKERYIADIYSDLKNQAEAENLAGNVNQALTLLRQYSGPMEEETEESRLLLAEQIENEHATETNRRKRQMEDFEARLQQYVEAAAQALLKNQALGGDIRATLANQAVPDPEHPIAQEAVYLQQQLEFVENIDFWILDGFRKDLGKKSTLGTTRGNLRLRVKAIEPDVLVTERLLEQGTLELRLGVKDLSLREQIERLSPLDDDFENLLVAIMALRERQPAAAIGYLEKTPGRLASALILLINEQMKEKSTQQQRERQENLESEAELSFESMLSRIGIDSKVREAHELRFKLIDLKLSDDQKQAIAQEADTFQKAYGDTAFYSDVELLLGSLLGLSAQAPSSPKTPPSLTP